MAPGPIHIGAKRLIGEALLPTSRRKLPHLPRRMRLDPLQHIDKIGVGINALQPAGGQQTLDHAYMLCAQFRPAEEPVLAAQGDRPDLTLQVIRVQRHLRVPKKDAQPRFPVQRIMGRLREGRDIVLQGIASALSVTLSDTRGQ